MPRTSRKEKQAHTRKCLLESASRVFTRRGLEQASVDEVAQDAGFTKGAFYANFKSKEELFLVMMDEKFGAEIERLEAALSGEGDPQAQARTAAGDVMRIVFADPEWPRLFFEFTAYAARNEEFRQELATRYRSLHERIAGIYERWCADFGGAPPFSIADLTTMTFCMANGFVLERLIEPDVKDEVYGEMVATFLAGVAARATSTEPLPAPQAS